MWRHGTLRSRPADLAPGTVRVVSVRTGITGRRVHVMRTRCWETGPWAMSRGTRWVVTHHKIMRRALAQLAEGLAGQIGPFGYRVCVDSAPVLEKALARNGGLGWIGKHTNLLARDAGSWFFLSVRS